MKRILTVLSLCLLAACLFLAGCGEQYEVSIGIGDGSKENGAVRVNYQIDGTISDGYIIVGNFTAESAADLDRTFVFSVCDADPLTASSYHERGLFSLRGSDLAALQKGDGSYGPLEFHIELAHLADYFTETDTAATVYFAFHVEGAARGDSTAISSSRYTYTYTSGKVTLSHD